MAKPSKFFIVSPTNKSKFVRTLQREVQTLVVNKVLRSTRQRAGRSQFRITLNPLNKIQQLQRFEAANVPHPPFTTSRDDLASLDAETIFARTLINATNGRGIVEFTYEDGPPPVAPLYTAYIPKKAEYRVHVFKEEVIDIQQKRKKRGFEQARDTRIRNMHNGYVYCRDGIVPPDGIAALAIRACIVCGYEYGAVDIIYNEKRNQCFVLEVNSRPGLMGTTLNRYGRAIAAKFGLTPKNTIQIR
jgi:hypothetical protein